MGRGFLLAVAMVLLAGCASDDPLKVISFNVRVCIDDTFDGENNWKFRMGIWASFFLEFYVAFFAFSFSADLGVVAALVMFAVGTIAVIVPTPNGAGPWHFAIITMMVLYGVGSRYSKASSGSSK